MAKKSRGGNSSSISGAVNFLAWLTGILVSLAVGFGMISGTLTIPYAYIKDVIPFFGWVVVILTLISAVLAIIDKL